MILHVTERAQASGADAVWVATDDESVRETCESAGVSVVMTRADHESGSERLAEACDLLSLEDGEVVVNVQGDEPLIPPEIITQVANLLDDCDEAAMASLYHLMESDADVTDPNAVKVVCDERNRALYFSRAPVPWDRDGNTLSRAPDIWRRHIGLYAYRAGFLREYVSWAPAPAERLEALEQLRALHHGATIIMAEAQKLPGPGIDTLADLERVRGMFNASPRQA